MTTSGPGMERYPHAQPATALVPPQPVPPLPVPVRRGRAASVWALGVLVLALLVLVAYFVLFLGVMAPVVGMVLALIPLGIVLFGVRLIDRWEPEPRSLIVFAVAWGAVAAVILALLVDLLLTVAVGPRSAALTAVVQAPLVEEVAKGLGLVLVFLMGRRTFDGPVDGIVYGALVGAGFAFTENIQYFSVSLLEGGGEQLTATFVLRGLVSPFAHAMFTAVTGYAMGRAARRSAASIGVIGAGATGALGAIVLHLVWNASATFANFFLLYVLLQVPLFVGFIIGIVILRREEARATQERLGDYARAGWFTPEEVTMLATPAGRRTALRWARGLRGDRRPLMKEFIADATALASVRQRALTGRDRFAAQDEQALLLRTRAARQALLAR